MSISQGSKTITDWKALRAKLVPGGDGVLWHEASHSYFLEGLSLRYLDPINVIQDNGTFQGEGFSIVAIQCTLIEFLESTAKGLSYRYLRSGERLGQYEYSSSEDLFVSFLCGRRPFAKEFDDQLAQDFYGGVGCGLLHEARTKNGWSIWAEGSSGNVISATAKIVYRNMAALLEYIDWYKGALLSDILLQEALRESSRHVRGPAGRGVGSHRPRATSPR